MRWLLRLGLAAVLLVVVAVAALWWYLDDAAMAAIEQGGELALGVPTKVDGVSVQPIAGRIEIEGVRIANPPGFSSRPFFSLGGGLVELDLASLLGDVVVVPVIALRDIELRLEQKGRRGNYDALIAGAGGSSAEASEAGSSGRGLLVRELRIENVVAHIDAEIVPGSRRALLVEIPTIVLRDIGSDSDSGVLASQLSEIVIDAVLAALLKQGVGLPPGLVADLKSLPVEVRGQLVKQAQDLEQDATRKAEGAIDDALADELGEDGAEAAKQGLRSLLGR